MYPALAAGRPDLPAAAAGAVSVIALLVTLAWAVARPRGWPEAVVAVPAAAVVVAAGAPAARALRQRRATPRQVARAADVPFLLFVLSLGIVVAAVTRNGLGSALAPLPRTCYWGDRA